jgi:integrase
MRRSKKVLTDRDVKGLRSRRSGEAMDGLAVGLGVRATATGRCFFFLRYGPRETRRRMTLGEYPGMSLESARREARRQRDQFKAGADPLVQRAAAATAARADSTRRRATENVESDPESFAALAALYIERHAKKKKRLRSAQEDERKLKVEVLPAWGTLKASEIRRRDVIALLEEIAEHRGGVCANRTQALLSKLFKFAIERELLDATPVAGVSRMHKEKPRERVLAAEELTVLWPALDVLHPVVASGWRLILLTGQRPGEVLQMRWSDIQQDLSGSWWTIPATVAKNGETHRVPLCRQAVAILDELRPLTGANEWVLESRQEGGHLRWLSHSNALLLKTTGLLRFTPHDLRRTAATMMGDRGVRPDMIDRVLNHKLKGITGIYNRATYDPEKRQALAILGDRVEAIVTGRPERSNVVSIGRSPQADRESG